MTPLEIAQANEDTLRKRVTSLLREQDEVQAEMIRLAAKMLMFRTWGERLTADQSRRLDEKIAATAIALRSLADKLV